MSNANSKVTATRRYARKSKTAPSASPPLSDTTRVADDPLTTQVKNLYKKGIISCSNVAHFELNLGRVNMKKFKNILDSMATLKEASCPCEIQACRNAWNFNYPGQLQTEFVVPGLYHKGVGSCDGVPKLVEPVAYTLTKKQIGDLAELYPNRLFITTGDGYHDHPVSNISNRINAARMWDRIPVGTTITDVIDINGNPTANENLMKRRPDLRIHTICHVVTGKDRIRMLEKWGPKLSADGTARWHDAYVRRDTLEGLTQVPFAQVKYVMSFHTLYYYSEKEIADILSLCPQAIMLACLHRHLGDKGSFYSEEHLWERRGVDIKQWNKHTGEAYVHPNTDVWFDYGALVVNNNSYDMNTAKALAWTINMLNPETFIIAITSVAYGVATTGNCRPVFSDERIGQAERTVRTTILSAAEIAVMTKVPLGDIFVDMPHPPGGGSYIVELEMLMALPQEKYNAQVFTSFQRRCAIKLKNTSIPPTDVDTLILVAYWANYAAKHDSERRIKTSHTTQINSGMSGEIAGQAVTSAASLLAGVVTGSWKQDLARCITNVASKGSALV